MIGCATLVSHSVSPATSVCGVTGSHGFLSSSSWSISSASQSHAIKAARPSSASKFFCQGGQACSRFPVWDVTYMGDGQPYPCCIGRSRPSYRVLLSLSMATSICFLRMQAWEYFIFHVCAQEAQKGFLN